MAIRCEACPRENAAFALPNKWSLAILIAALRGLMLQTFDTLIAFAVIMTVLSLVVTIVVQMCSAALALRGKNLANGLALTFQTIDPKIGEDAHTLAAQILQDPIFSDSLFAPKQRMPVHFPDEMMPVIAAERALRDAESALAAAPEDQNLMKAVQQAEQTLAAVRPTMPVLSNPASSQKAPWRFLSKGAMHLGSAIRPGEVYRILQDWGGLTATEAALNGVPPALAAKAKVLLEALRQPDGPATEAASKLAALSNMAERFTTAEEKQAVVNALAHLGTTVERATTQAYDRFQRWFGTAQDRAEQWFQIHVRGLTIAAAIATAFGLQLDTIDIFRQVRASPHLLRALVDTAAPALLEKGGTALDPTDTPAQLAYQKWLGQHPLYALDALPVGGGKAEYQGAITKRLQTAPDNGYSLAQFDRAFEKWKATDATGVAKAASDSDAAKAAYFAWAKRFPSYGLADEPDWTEANKENIRGTVAKQLAQVHDDAFGKTPESQRDARQRWLRDYEDAFIEGASAFLEGRRELMQSLTSELEKAGFDLIPQPLLHRWKNEQPSSFWAHLIGMAITAGLLTLGAPFWFNLLKNLMSLRPAVASLIERRPQSAPALPSSPPSAAPPS